MRLKVAASELKEQITFEYHQHQTLGTARRTADQVHDLHLLRKRSPGLPWTHDWLYIGRDRQQGLLLGRHDDGGNGWWHDGRQ